MVGYISAAQEQPLQNNEVLSGSVYILAFIKRERERERERERACNKVNDYVSQPLVTAKLSKQEFKCNMHGVSILRGLSSAGTFRLTRLSIFASL